MLPSTLVTAIDAGRNIVTIGTEDDLFATMLDQKLIGPKDIERYLGYTIRLMANLPNDAGKPRRSESFARNLRLYIDLYFSEGDVLKVMRCVKGCDIGYRNEDERGSDRTKLQGECERGDWRRLVEDARIKAEKRRMRLREEAAPKP